MISGLVLSLATMTTIKLASTVSSKVEGDGEVSNEYGELKQRRSERTFFAVANGCTYCQSIQSHSVSPTPGTKQIIRNRQCSCQNIVQAGPEWSLHIHKAVRTCSNVTYGQLLCLWSVEFDSRHGRCSESMASALLLTKRCP